MLGRSREPALPGGRQGKQWQDLGPYCVDGPYYACLGLAEERESMRLDIKVYIEVKVHTMFWGFPKNRDTIMRVPIIRIIVYLGSILGYPSFEKLPFSLLERSYCSQSLSLATALHFQWIFEGKRATMGFPEVLGSP